MESMWNHPAFKGGVVIHRDFYASAYAIQSSVFYFERRSFFVSINTKTSIKFPTSRY